MDLLGWLDNPVTERGVEFARDREWERWSWAELANAVNAATGEICAHQASAAGRVAIIIPNGPEFVAAFYGALAAGATPCPIAPPTVLDRPDEYARYLHSLLTVAEPSLVLTVAEFLPLLYAGQAGIGCPLHPLVASRAPAPQTPRRAAPSLALLQFTSGSAGRPRAVRISAENLAANVQMVIDTVKHDPAVDQGVSWLPTYHDMGLIGGTLAPATATIELRVMRPEQFVIDPLRWLACFGEGDGTISGGPPFGFAYAAKRARDEQLEPMDFSRWRLAIVGAERIDAGVLGRFLERLAPYGLRETLFVPAYGLAEATLMVSINTERQVAAVIRPDWETMRFGKKVTVEAIASLVDRRTVMDGAEWLVSCGRCPAGAAVDVIDEDGRSLPEGTLGEIRVHGRCVADSYHGDDETRTSSFSKGTVRTGDAGLQLSGELYVIGRMADSIKIRGRWVFVEDLEARVQQRRLIDRGRCVLFSGSRADGEVIVVLGEADPGPWAEQLGSLLHKELGSAVKVEVHAAARGTIERTSSGKPRRRVMWQRYLAGDLQASCIFVATPQRADPVRCDGERRDAELESAPG